MSTQLKIAIEELFGELPYKTLVKGVKDFAIFHLDCRGVIVSWNEGAQYIFGYTEDEIHNQPLDIIFTLEDKAQKIPEKELKKARTKGRAEDTRWHLRKDGTRFYANGVTISLRDDKGTLLGYAKIASDVTQRKLIEEALRTSEEQYRIVAETASDVIISINEQSTILFINRAAERIFGYQVEQMLGQKLTILMPEYLRHLHKAGLERYVKTGNRHLSWEHVEVPGLHRDGYEFPLELSFGEFSKNDEHVFIGVARDISERKQVEADRERLLEQEQQARRTAEEADKIKDEFLATLSHELRTPLNAILGWSSLLRSGQLSEEESARALETVERNARSQSQLIDDLLDISRIITGKLRLETRAVKISDVIEAAIEVIRPGAEAKNINLEVLLTEEGTILGDANRLQQVFWNLLTNAVKFTPKGGTMRVLLQRVDSYFEVNVSDTGKGISPEFLPHIFDRFRQADQTTTRKQGGLGLGLSIVRQLVEMHGGTVHAESKGESKGSTFVVKLPLSAIMPQRDNVTGGGSAYQSHPADFIKIKCAPAELDGIHVLVLDDEADSRELIRTVLEHYGSRVTTTSSAAEALAALKKNRPDILISDIGMPEEDGYSLIRKVRALPKEKGGLVPQ